MGKQAAIGFIPYEIGDIVILKNSIFEHAIEDIRMIQYIKDRKVEFEVLLMDTWFAATLIDKRIISNKTKTP